MTPCVFTDPVDVGTTENGFIIVRMVCTQHGAIAACSVFPLANMDQVASEMRDQLEAHCFEKFMKEQMGTLKKENQ